MRRTLAVVIFLLLCRHLARGAPEAILVLAADQHSAYERSAQFVAHVDRLRGENPRVPLAVLIDGDAFEFGNVVARRTSGAIDFAMLAALARRAPTVVNLGNHEPEFYDVAETVTRLEAAGVKVVSGNLRRATDGKPYAPPAINLTLGAREAVIVGVATDRLATFRAAVRPELDLADPIAWAKQNFGVLLGEAALPIVLSHAGLRADRAMLPLVPDGTLFVGAHDHVRLIHAAGRTTYVHCGSWMEVLTVARLISDHGKPRWEIEQVPIGVGDPADPELRRRIEATLAEQLTAEEKAVVGRAPRAMAPGEAARFAVDAARGAAGADVAVIGATTFGAGLPQGPVTRFAFDACVRFDGPLYAGEIDGARLRQIMAHANQGPETPFEQRTGENLIAIAPPKIGADRTYRLVTTDWVAKNAKAYLGDDPPALVELPTLTLKTAVIKALNR